MIRWRRMFLNSTTDAAFRLWGSEVSAALAALGWIQTADVGQINWATVLAPTLSGQIRGYEIWRANDSLASSFPFYVKVGYGASGGAARPAIWHRFGTGSDGALNLIGAGYEQTLSSNNTNDGATVSTSVAFVGDAGRFAIFTDPSDIAGSVPLVTGWERTSQFGEFDGRGAVGWGKYWLTQNELQTNVHQWGAAARTSFYEILTPWGDSAVKSGSYKDGAVLIPAFYNLTNGFPAGELQSVVTAASDAVPLGCVVEIPFMGRRRPYLFSKKLTCTASMGGAGASYRLGLWFE